ncbi:GNAT family N-acetyltransferase [Methanobrevibacter woesei]|uniref:GNAT family N-acetyltransferase n=1 Tax=Methanobrevibacter woesei TaxID=190976 RepID=UPI0026DFA366|nr:GNAT family N-acetyltransferase [Methanobrevibacter woesei]
MELIELQDEDLSKFKMLLQESFQYGYENVYGKCEELILPEKDIDECLKKENSNVYVMKNDDSILRGVIVETNEKTQHNHLDFLFVRTSGQNKGIGQKIWEEIETLYPNTKIWETCTLYFDKRNIHFYVNKLGFHIVEFLNEKNPEPDWDKDRPMSGEEMFRFEKVMK